MRLDDFDDVIQTGLESIHYIINCGDSDIIKDMKICLTKKLYTGKFDLYVRGMVGGECIGVTTNKYPLELLESYSKSEFLHYHRWMLYRQYKILTRPPIL